MEENNNYRWKIFISHAAEDKESFVDTFAKTLSKNDITNWYDKNEIQLGHSITESINYGLKNSEFVVVILSKNYIKKGWTNTEINSYFANDGDKAKRVMPIWHNVTKQEVHDFAPILVDRLSANSSQGYETIIEKIKRRLNVNLSEVPIQQNLIKKEYLSILDKPIDWPTLNEYTTYRFGKLGMNQFWQVSLFTDISMLPKYKTIRDLDKVVYNSSIAIAAYAREKIQIIFKQEQIS